MVSYSRRNRCLVAILVVLCLAETAHAGWWLRPRCRVPGHWYVAARPVEQGPAKPQPKKSSQSPLVPNQTQALFPWQYPLPSYAQPARTPAQPIRYGRSTVTFDNQSGEPALVRLVGPTRAEVYVPNGATGAIRNVAPGHYFIRVRYGTPGNYGYAEGDPFDVHGSATSYSHTRITLHTVPAGNYAIRYVSAGDFDAAAP